KSLSGSNINSLTLGQRNTSYNNRKRRRQSFSKGMGGGEMWPSASSICWASLKMTLMPA
ncbi:hypothetical protein PspLS_04862, partial [Pyricularia sp. CBS 133598]